MNLDDVVASPDAALACAAALEAQLGDDSLLTVGRTHRSFSEVLADRPVRVAEVEFTAADDSRGTLALIMSVPFAEAVERASADEVLLTAARIAFEATAQRLGELASVELHIGAPAESDGDAVRQSETEGRSVVYPFLDGTQPVACLSFSLERADADAGARGAPGAPDARSTPGSVSAWSELGSAFVLADVEMGVTAELGRTRMTVREVLSITPGAVIDLDRSAGTPVDVLVNGTLIARGEVVVVDEEFGIRISEIIPQRTASV